MTMFKGQAWWCSGCLKWHPISRYVEGEGATGGSWCRHAIQSGLRSGRNIDLPGYVLDGHRREMGLL